MLDDLIDTSDYFDPVAVLQELDEQGLMEYCYAWTESEEQAEDDTGRYWAIQGSVSDCRESGSQTCGREGLSAA